MAESLSSPACPSPVSVPIHIIRFERQFGLALPEHPPEGEKQIAARRFSRMGGDEGDGSRRRQSGEWVCSGQACSIFCVKGDSPSSRREQLSTAIASVKNCSPHIRQKQLH